MKKGTLSPIVLLAVMTVFVGTMARAQSPGRVGLVVQYEDDEVLTRCIEFTEPQISGLDVLLRSGLDLVYNVGGMGATVCKIGHKGCDDPAHCFCRCKGDKCEYWSYWHLIDGRWQYSGVGADGYVVKSGAVEGWVWGAGTINSAPSPPAVSFQDICGPKTPPTPVATSTSLPTSTPSSAPTATHSPSPTPTMVIATPTTLPTSLPATPIIPTDTPRPRSPPVPTTATTRGYPAAGMISFFLLLIILATIGAVVHRRRFRR